MRPEYARGAANAVKVCLGVEGRDRVVVILDRSRQEIADAILEEARSTGAEVAAFLMEDYVQRPAGEFPRRLAEDIMTFQPTVSYFVGGGLPGELAFRQPMRQLLVHTLGCRHGHMIGIDDQVMRDGMAADYEDVYRVTRQVYEAVRQADRIEVATALGTRLVARFSRERRWIPCDGRYLTPGSWGNLPEGEVYTAPLTLDGILIGEEMGDYFAERYGLFPNPVRIEVAGGRVASVELEGDPRLKAEIEAYLAQSPNSSRVGEFAIGTNMGLTRIVGNFLQDEKFPGAHVAFGDPYPEETGADWSAPTHVDVLASHADVFVDGRQIMAGGRLTL